MNNLFTLSLIFILLVNSVFAQAGDVKPEQLDTIYANDQKNVALFFPDPIRQGITGSENVVFTYNREDQQYLGLLQATPGKESNLLVISNLGLIFSYIIKYSEDLKKLNYFIDKTGSIGNESPDYNKPMTDGKEYFTGNISDKKETKKDFYFENFSKYLLKSKQRLGKIKKREEGIRIEVVNIVFHGEDLYFVLKLKNASNIDYEPSFLSISVENRQKGKRKSIQKLLQDPLYTYKMPEKVKRGKSARFVYVLPKFSISDDKVVVIDLKEQDGERDIKLKVKKKYINNPN